MPYIYEEVNPKLKMPFVSVIIPVLDDYVRLKKCIRALEQQDYPKKQFEVIVVDNGSKNKNEIIDSKKIKIVFLEEEKKGSYAARNLGVSVSKGEICAFTDADCIPFSDWLSQGISKLILEKNCRPVAGKIDVFSKVEHSPNVVEFYEQLSAFRQQEYVDLGKFGVTANLFIPKNIFDDVGLFNAELMSSGDKEWGKRAHSKGYPTVYSETACIRHPARSTLVSLKRKNLRIALGLHQLSTIQKKRGLAFFLSKIRRAARVVSDIVRTIKFVCQILIGSGSVMRGKRLPVALLACYTRHIKVAESIRLELGFLPRALEESL